MVISAMLRGISMKFFSSFLKTKRVALSFLMMDFAPSQREVPYAEV